MIFTPPKRSISRVFIHCSASDNPAHDDISVIRQWHLERGFKDVGYHYFIKFDGTVQPGRNIEITPAAQEGNNAHTIAICCAGLSKFTEAQFASLRTLCGEINTALPHVTYHGHCEVNRHKTCPVFNYKKVLGLDAKGVMILTN
jgi:N-acetylmuramoyl-L-alanine amidase